MVSFPPCKINLGLNVIRKRSDGYHDIETCFYPVAWTDILEIIPSGQFSFTQTGITIPGAGKNLCITAYELLKKEYDLKPVSVHLHKIIPTGAGLGGGSSNAAYALQLLNSIFSLALTKDDLRHYASSLGSDCSFFITDEAMIGTSRGEVLHPVTVEQLKGKFIIIVKPEVHVSTAEAYAGVIPAEPTITIRQILTEVSIDEWREKLKNDFEPSVFKHHPEIRLIKERLYHEGALYASMSGSGSSVFGIFESPLSIQHIFPGCIMWCGQLSL